MENHSAKRTDQFVCPTQKHTLDDLKWMNFIYQHRRSKKYWINILYCTLKQNCQLWILVSYSCRYARRRTFWKQLIYVLWRWYFFRLVQCPYRIPVKEVAVQIHCWNTTGTIKIKINPVVKNTGCSSIYGTWATFIRRSSVTGFSRRCLCLSCHRWFWCRCCCLWRKGRSVTQNLCTTSGT